MRNAKLMRLDLEKVAQALDKGFPKHTLTWDDENQFYELQEDPSWNGIKLRLEHLGYRDIDHWALVIRKSLWNMKDEQVQGILDSVIPNTDIDYFVPQGERQDASHWEYWYK